MDNTTDNRAQLIQIWLNKYYDIVEDSFTAVSGDASFRRYFRFIANNALGYNHISLIAVDAPPQLENSQPFIDIANLLLENELPVPEIYNYSLEDGFYTQKDFGNCLLHSTLNKNTSDHLYGIAMRHIIGMQKISSSDLPTYNSELLQREMSLFSDWYLSKHKNVAINNQLQSMLTHTYNLLEDSALEQPQTFVHRDYHSRNLMIIDYDQIGIIDFQDAIQGPITYDLVSLLRDCYIDWPQERINLWVEQFILLLPEQFSNDQFVRWFDLMGIQRHLKAIGIFCRLNYRDNKMSYLNDIPRTLNYVINVSAKYEELKPFYSFVSTLA